MNIFKSILLPGAMAAATIGGSAMAQTKWDVPTSYAPTIYHTQNLQQMADDVDKATSGKLKLVLHSNASLFKLNEIKRAVQTGQAQAGEVLISVLENENRVFGVDSVPFLATSYGDARKLWQASKPVYDEVLGKQGLKLLYSVPWPAQALFTKKPINSAADLKGLKWRAYNPATSRLGELLGAQPVTVPTADLAQAVATGTVDAFVSSSPVGVQLKLWESMTHYYAIDAWVPKNMVIVNARAFNALDKQTQGVVLKAAAEAETRGWKMNEDEATERVAVLAKNGMKIEKPPAPLKADLDRIGQTMLAEWLRSGGPEGQKIVDTFKK
jgi:TRAP-type C4-dicarboxylate transport system substrate-binding protein